MNSIVQLNNVTKVYASGSQEYAAVKNVSFSGDKGSFTLLLGPSGSGKTTLLAILAGFIKTSFGEVILFGSNINDYSAKELQRLRMKKIGFVFQSFLLIDCLSVEENIELVTSFGGMRQNKKQILECMDRVGISHLAKKRPAELSHGERQRTAIARALVNNAELFIADEPTASIETEQGQNIINILHALAKENNSCVITASHDQRLKQFADRCLLIENGSLKGG